MGWRDDPMTEKQMGKIYAMQCASKGFVPKFKGETKGDAYDFINKYLKLWHERKEMEVANEQNKPHN